MAGRVYFVIMVLGRIVPVLMASIVLIGCAPATRLELEGNPKGPAVYEFRQVMWRSTPDGIEMLGYGFIPFRNDQFDRDYNPRWPASGFVTFWLHGAPEPEERYLIQLLGPAKLLGPGDDEVLTANIPHVEIESSGTARVINLKQVPTKSRNHPEMSFTLSGYLIARPANESEFDRQLKQYNYELESRKIP